MDSRIEKLAEVLVNYSVAVKPGDLVAIKGSALAEPLLQAIYKQTLLAGGNPLLRVSADWTQELLLKYGNDNQLRYLTPLRLQEVEQIDASIGIWAEVNTKALSKLDPARQAIMSKTSQPVMQRFMARAAEGTLRWTGTMFPTQSSAQDANMSLLDYEDFVYDAGLLDKPDPIAAWQEVALKQQALVNMLNEGSTLEIETDKGTSLKMSIAGRKWINCCGKENFPDGEVFTGPVEDSVEGEVAFSFPAVYRGNECVNVCLRFEGGKVVQASADKGEHFLLSMLDQDEGARRVGEIAFGCNRNIVDFTCNTLFDEKIGGTMHLAVGASYPETGGVNQSGLHWDMVCDLRTGGRVLLDGKVVNENGNWMGVEL